MIFGGPSARALFYAKPGTVYNYLSRNLFNMQFNASRGIKFEWIVIKIIRVADVGGCSPERTLQLTHIPTAI